MARVGRSAAFMRELRRKHHLGEFRRGRTRRVRPSTRTRSRARTFSRARGRTRSRTRLSAFSL